jgi:CBS domain-containing protein
MKKCRDVMTADPVFCTPGDKVSQVVGLMRTQDVGAIPICEDRDGKKLVGIVTDRDLTLRVTAEGKDPNSAKIMEVMTRELVTCSPDADLQEALDAMEAHQVRRIPVTNDRGVLIGIIAQADVATRSEEPEKTAELLEEVSRPPVARAT